MDLRTATPVEIDTELARIFNEQGKAQARLAGLENTMKRYRKYADETGYYADVFENARQQADKMKDQVRKLKQEAEPFEREYVRRGGWTRAFLVVNANGHVHNTTACGTCYPTTQFAWLPEFSGHNETEVVEAAGEKACTVCFPTAPVDVLRRKSTIELPERRAARLERERKAAEKAAKAITNPDGTPLRGRFGALKTEQAAWNQIVDTLVTIRYYGYRDDEERRDENARILAALVHKTGQTEAEVLATVEQKVVAKAKRERVYR